MMTSTRSTPDSVLAITLPGIRIRDMRSADLDEVLRIEQASFTHPWTKVHFLSSLVRRPAAQSWVAVSEERIEGYVIAWYISRYSDEAGEVHIHNIAVHPESRRTGIGKLLLHTAAEQGYTLHCSEVSLEVRASNDRARQFYNTCGFRVSGRRKNYYGDDDALVMITGVETMLATI